MKKSYLGLILLLMLLSTFNPKFSFIINSKLNIKKIIIDNNSILDSGKIKQKLNFLYEENLFFFKMKDIEKNLKKISFIESFSVKKIFPNKIKITINEKNPVAILQNKKEKFYISEKGDLINFREAVITKDLPIVFGNGKTFYSLYHNLNKIKFPLETIKSFYFFESGRWDIIMHDNKVIKLPTTNYLFALESFMISKKNINFKNYTIFDYRINDQLILN